MKTQVPQYLSKTDMVKTYMLWNDEIINGVFTELSFYLTLFLFR